MRTENLSIFLTVAKYHSISEAARCEHMTQPAISSIIRQLENQYNIILFNRYTGQRRPLELTKEGEIFYKYAQQILKLNSQMEYELASLNVSELPLTIGTGKSNGIYILPRIVQKFISAYPEIKLSIQSYPDSYVVISQLQDHHCDLGISMIYPDSQEFFCKKILSDPYLLLCPPNMKIPAAISIQELKELPLIIRERNCLSYNVVNNELMKLGMSLEEMNVVMTAYDNAALYHAIADGVGCGFIMRSIIYNHQNSAVRGKVVRVRHLHIGRDVYLIRNHDSIATPNSKLFWNFTINNSW